MLLICSKKIVDSRLYMDGIFGPINTGHMPIDFRYMMQYNRYKLVKIESVIKALSIWIRAS